MTTFHFGENLISPFWWGDSKVVWVIEKCLLQCLGLWPIPYTPLWMFVFYDSKKMIKEIYQVLIFGRNGLH
jgi:hypothetical protein